MSQRRSRSARVRRLARVRRRTRSRSGTRRLAQINRTNVRQLEVAWTYDSGETGGLQTNPIVVDDVLFTTTPKHRVVALDAATGAVRWTFDSGIEGRGPNRGVTYWSSGDDAPDLHRPGSVRLRARCRGPGRPIAGFGRAGRIDLREGLGRDPSTQSVALTTPGVVYKDLLIVGGRVSEGLPASPGDIRAYDARTGALRWSVSHDSASGRDRIRHLAGRRVDLHRRRQQLGGHGRRRGARRRVRADRIRISRLLRRQPARRRSVRELADRARRGDGPPAVAFSSGSSRHLGSRFSVAAQPRHRHAERPPHRCGRADDEARVRVPVRSIHWHPAVSDRVARDTRRAPSTASVRPRRSRCRPGRRRSRVSGSPSRC